MPQEHGDVLVGGGAARVKLTADVAIGCTFLVIYNVVMLAMIQIRKNRVGSRVCPRTSFRGSGTAWSTTWY